MPELPEVETTLRGIEPHLLNQQVAHVIVRDPRLRWPVPDAVSKAEGQKFVSLERRGKYLLLKLQAGRTHHPPWYVGLITYLCGTRKTRKNMIMSMSNWKMAHVFASTTHVVLALFVGGRRYACPRIIA